MQVIEKVLAYITNAHRLLVFEHVGLPEAGVQVPGGSLQSGESPLAAAIREAEEETGLTGFGHAFPLGISEFDVRPFGKDEIHRRHFMHLPFPGAVHERWRWFEDDPSDGSPGHIEFELYWVSFGEAKTLLSFGCDAMIYVLSERESIR